MVVNLLSRMQNPLPPGTAHSRKRSGEPDWKKTRHSDKAEAKRKVNLNVAADRAGTLLHTIQKIDGL